MEADADAETDLDAEADMEAESEEATDVEADEQTDEATDAEKLKEDCEKQGGTLQPPANICIKIKVKINTDGANGAAGPTNVHAKIHVKPNGAGPTKVHAKIDVKPNGQQ